MGREPAGRTPAPWHRFFGCRRYAGKNILLVPYTGRVLPKKSPMVSMKIRWRNIGPRLVFSPPVRGTPPSRPPLAPPGPHPTHPLARNRGTARFSMFLFAGRPYFLLPCFHVFFSRGAHVFWASQACDGRRKTKNAGELLILPPTVQSRFSFS